MSNGQTIKPAGCNTIFALPMEIWKNILEQVKLPIDKLNCSQVCKSWKEILKESQPNWLFAEVFKSIFPYLDRKDVLKCRFVSSAWCDGVDNYLDTHYCRPIYNESAVCSRRDSITGSSSILRDKKVEWIKINNVRQLAIWEGNKSNRNPFPGRSLWVVFDSTSMNFWIIMTDFMESFGSNVTHFVLEFQGSNSIEVYQRLAEYLSNLPNIKSLQIFGNLESRGTLPLVVLQKVMQEEMPVVPDLESLEIGSFPRLPVVIMRHLIRIYAEQLKRLKIRDFSVFHRLTFLNEGLSNLKELHLTVKSIHKLDCLLKKIERSPLAILVLKMTPACAFFLNVQVFFYAIGRFENTLRSLRIECAAGGLALSLLGLGQICQPELHCRLLQRLELEGITSVSLHFLKGLVNLEYLGLKNVSLGIQPSTEYDKILYKEILENRLYDSSIWNELPNLKKVVCENPVGNRRFMGGGAKTFRKCVFTRDGYQHSSNTAKE